ncbi:MFS transporter [Alphaproteobacteria bacterium]|nr:MFS transporter [Alphaproteobacteria bacterium]
MDHKTFKRATFAVILCSSYPMLIVGCYFGLIPWNMERLQIDESDLGFAILTFGVSFLISNQVVGRFLVPKFGTKKIMTIGIVIISFSNIVLVSAPEYYILLLAHIPAGIGWGSSGPIGAIHAQLIEKHSGKIISPYYAMGFNIGIFVGGILAGFILGNEINPTLIFFFLFFTSIFISIIVYINGLSKDLDFKGKGEKLKLPEKNVLIFGFLLFVIFGSNGIIIDWSALWFTKELDAPLYLASLGLIFLSLGGIFANLFSNQLINLFSEKIVGCYFVIFGSTLLFFSITQLNFYFILITFFIYGFCSANLVPIIIRQAVKHSSESIPTTVTNLITMGFSAMLFAPAIIGFVAETFSLTTNMYALSIIVFIAGNIFLRQFRSN